MKKYPGATKDELDDIGDLIHQERLEERMQEEGQAMKDARKEAEGKMVAISGEFEQVCPHGVNRSHTCLRCDDAELSQKEINRLKGELERVSRDAQIATDTRGETYKMLTTRAEKAEDELQASEIRCEQISINADIKIVDLHTRLEKAKHGWTECVISFTAERTSHKEAKRALELEQKKSSDWEKITDDLLGAVNWASDNMTWYGSPNRSNQQLTPDEIRSQAKGGK